MRRTQELFVNFKTWLISEKKRSQNSAYVTISQIRVIVRGCLSKDKKYMPKESDFAEISSQMVDVFINTMKQRNRSPFRRSWDLWAEFSNLENSQYKEDNPEIRRILKKYAMKQPINWCFTGELCNGKHIVYNSEYKLRRMIDESDFEILRNGRKDFKNQKIWKNRVK